VGLGLFLWSSLGPLDVFGLSVFSQQNLDKKTKEMIEKGV
jgi:hypothetical protein